MYGKGISREGSLLDVGVDLGIVKKSGAWFTYEGEQLGQGRENSKQFLTENVELMVEISEKIRQAVGIDDEPESRGGPHRRPKTDRGHGRRRELTAEPGEVGRGAGRFPPPGFRTCRAWRRCAVATFFEARGRKATPFGVPSPVTSS